jgi:hypothetical protein
VLCTISGGPFSQKYFVGNGTSTARPAFKQAFHKSLGSVSLGSMIVGFIETLNFVVSLLTGRWCRQPSCSICRADDWSRYLLRDRLCDGLGCASLPVERCEMLTRYQCFFPIAIMNWLLHMFNKCELVIARDDGSANRWLSQMFGT